MSQFKRHRVYHVYHAERISDFGICDNHIDTIEIPASKNAYRDLEHADYIACDRHGNRGIHVAYVRDSFRHNQTP